MCEDISIAKVLTSFTGLSCSTTVRMALHHMSRSGNTVSRRRRCRLEAPFEHQAKHDTWRPWEKWLLSKLQAHYEESFHPCSTFTLSMNYASTLIRAYHFLSFPEAVRLLSLFRTDSQLCFAFSQLCISSPMHLSSDTLDSGRISRDLARFHVNRQQELRPSPGIPREPTDRAVEDRSRAPKAPCLRRMVPALCFSI